MNKIILTYAKIVFFFIPLIFLNTCGLEDNLIYFQEPRNVHVENNGTGTVKVYFYAYNEEEDAGDKLCCGYDVYYYFTNSSNAKRAAVKIPILTGRNSDFSELEDYTKFDRFPDDIFDKDDIYQLITIPVTNNMLNEVLDEKGNNDNVRFCFHNDESIIKDLSGDYNPKINSGEDYIFMEEIFPNYDEYQGEDWGENDPDFKGFYDQDYYDEMGISPVETVGTDKTYKMYIWIIAKGHNSAGEISKDFTESIKSSIITVNLKVDASPGPSGTDNH